MSECKKLFCHTGRHRPKSSKQKYKVFNTKIEEKIACTDMLKALNVTELSTLAVFTNKKILKSTFKRN